VLFNFVLSSESVIALESQSDLKPLLDVVNTLVISMAECEHLLSSMNDVFTPTGNLLLLQNVSDLIFLKYSGPPPRHFHPEGFIDISHWK
jgi:hypothetical protein